MTQDTLTVFRHQEFEMNGGEKMKRATEEKIKLYKKAWKDLQDILKSYRKKDDFSTILVENLEGLVKGYEKEVFHVCLEE